MSEFTSNSSRGAASEMFACAHLLKSGYHVFRSVSPACPFDGMAYKDGESLRFEVKSLSVVPAIAFSWPANDEWDLLLVVAPSGEVYEFTHPLTYEEVRDCLRAAHGFLPGPPRGQRGAGKTLPRKNYSTKPLATLVHGTWSGYCLHKRDGSPVCDPCEAARQALVTANRARRVAARKAAPGEAPS